MRASVLLDVEKKAMAVSTAPSLFAVGRVSSRNGASRRYVNDCRSTHLKCSVQLRLEHRVFALHAAKSLRARRAGAHPDACATTTPSNGTDTPTRGRGTPPPSPLYLIRKDPDSLSWTPPPSDGRHTPTKTHPCLGVWASSGARVVGPGYNTRLTAKQRTWEG